MLFLVLLCFVSMTHAQSGPIVNTTEGLVQGVQANDGNYSIFYGIYYGGPASGENRFKAPTPPLPITGTFQAIDSRMLCAQPSPRGLIGVEDCLTLSIFTGNLVTPKPVVVFLNGEEYANGDAGTFSYRRLIEENLLVVTVNYRLSIFGFLCLGVSEAPGNAGLKDVVQALNWIQQNIASFGGDPNNVLLLGHGSGAAMVDLITLSPLANNLVHKAMAISGSSLSPWAVAYKPVEQAHAFGAKLGYTDKSNAELAELLINTSVTVLAGPLSDNELTNNSALFAPCIENANLNPTGAFLVEAPIDVLRSGNYSQIPYVAAYTNREGTQRAQQAETDRWLERMQENFTNFIQVDLDLQSNETAVSEIRQFYFGSSSINMAVIEDYLDYQGDSLALISVVRGAKERALTSRGPVRLMEFSYRGTLNSDWVFTRIPLNGARHGAILNYLFDFDLRTIDNSAKEAVIGRFAAFAHTGVPITTPPDVRGNSVWEPISVSFNYLYVSGGDGPVANQTSIFSQTSRVNPHPRRVEFWEDLYSKYYAPPRPVSSADKLFSFALVVMLSQILVRIF